MATQIRLLSETCKEQSDSTTEVTTIAEAGERHRAGATQAKSENITRPDEHSVNESARGVRLQDARSR